MPTRKLFPALRCRMGDWVYYVTFMSFADVDKWIRPTDEIHKSARLSEWIQRQLVNNHAEAIATYLRNQPERMFNALFVGVYGGEPQWGELQISAPSGTVPFDATDDELDTLSRSIGVLCLSGEEKLFAVDGQHRVVGIKQAVAEDPQLGDEEVSVILVGHQTTPDGRSRAQRLFTTLNTTAKHVSQTDLIALDEDNGAAIVTRRMIDEFDLFEAGHFIAFAPGANLRDVDIDAITSVVTLYKLVETLVPCVPGIKKASFIHGRPSNVALNEAYKLCCVYWTLLLEHISQYRDVLQFKTKRAVDFRKPDSNHLLFRPIGQRVFAEATTRLVQTLNWGLDTAIAQLATAPLWLHEPTWYYILWNPRDETMLAKPKNKALAKVHLLKAISQDVKLAKQDRTAYEELMAARGGC